MSGSELGYKCRSILEPVANGDVFDRSEFSKVMRIADSDIMEFDTALQSPAQAIDSAEPQRWILEFIQSSRKHDPKRRRAGGQGLRLKYVGVHPGPECIDLVFSTRVGPLQPLRDEGIDAKEFCACGDGEPFACIVHERVSPKHLIHLQLRSPHAWLDVYKWRLVRRTTPRNR